jgi:hypothetical protein
VQAEEGKRGQGSRGFSTFLAADLWSLKTEGATKVNTQIYTELFPQRPGDSPNI